MRVTKGTDYQLTSPTFVGGADRETATATTGTPTCSVTTAAGVTLTAPAVSSGSTTGVYVAALTGAIHTANLDCLTVVWNGTVTGTGAQTFRQTVDVVGSHYVTATELRTYPDLSDKTKYPALFLADIRDEYADLVERVCGVAFVSKYARELHFGTGQRTIALGNVRPSAVRSVTIDGVSVSPALFDYTPGGRLVYVNGVFSKTTDGSRNVIVEYEHGHASPPSKLKREVLKCIRAEALATRSAVPNNAISQTFDGVTIRFSTPDRNNGRPTGILTLDPVLNEYSERIPGIA